MYLDTVIDLISYHFKVTVTYTLQVSDIVISLTII